MRLGEVVGACRIVTQPTSKGSSGSTWAVGESEGQKYFIKEYLAPTYPSEEGPGSTAMKQAMRQECRRFVRRVRAISERMPKDDRSLANIARPLDFFRQGPRYYRITEYHAPADVPLLSQMAGRQALILIRGVCDALATLHENGIIHGDVRPENVLFTRARDDVLIAILTDVDDGFLEEFPPTPERFVCDLERAAPEVLAWVEGRTADTVLGPPADVYTYGRWMADVIPVPESVLAGAVEIGALGEIVSSSLRVDAASRPSIAELKTLLNRMTPADFESSVRKCVDSEGGMA